MPLMAERTNEDLVVRAARISFDGNSALSFSYGFSVIASFFHSIV